MSESQPIVGLTDSNWIKSVSDNDLGYTETTLISQDVRKIEVKQWDLQG